MPPSAIYIPPRGANLRHLRTGRPKRKARPSLRDECRAAVLPSLVIGAVWCLGCYIYLWISLYRSFTEEIANDGKHIQFNKRRDVLAIKLEQFLAGKEGPPEGEEGESDALDGGQGNGTGSRAIHPSSYVSASLLENIADQTIARQIQSTLVSKTGYPNLVLGAYLEPLLPTEEGDGGTVERLKLRTQSPRELTYASYPYQRPDPHKPMVGACARRGAQFFPTLHPKELDNHFGGNVFKKYPDFDKRWELALGVGHTKNNTLPSEGYCPVDADPFLPWIHDAFPSNDGRYVELVIANKRRCNTDPKTFADDLKNLEPQVALMQPVPVKRMQEGDEGKYAAALSELWSPESQSNQGVNQAESFLLNDDDYKPPRYILGTSLDDADGDGKYTRFICRFHTLVMERGGVASKDGPSLRKVVLGETLSAYPYNPEHANYRKRGSQPMLTPLEKGKDEQIWNSVYSARCPVPLLKDEGGNANEALASIVASGQSVFEGTPSIYLDLVPIRTPARRTREGFSIPGVNSAPMFDPRSAWGDSHVVPRVEASGRWTNIPICQSPKVDELASIATESKRNGVKDATTNLLGKAQNKTHFLVGCVWASESFATRGQTDDTDSSTSDRLREFLAYHTQIAGFDHIYLYDNSDPSGSDLSNVTALFPPSSVTRIPWPHRVCNNNRPMHANPGERSSQYAAESSCRARYGPDTTWMATLDVDEYLIPTGKEWRSLRHWLEHVTATEEKTKILSFYMTRALPDIDLMIPYNGTPASSCEVGGDSALDSTCAMKDPQKTFMETYNCEPTTHPKPKSWAWRAKKQIYRPDFVLNHYVHYPVVTSRILDTPLESSARFFEKSPFERRVDELTEGYLLHAKTTGPEQTSGWHEKCSRKGAGTKNASCKVGIPSQEKFLGGDTAANTKGGNAGPSSAFESNCYRHSKVNEIVPQLEEALRSLAEW
ncbi:hypothetical protein ACHAXT_005282 [Thalassiosira profunda]